MARVNRKVNGRKLTDIIALHRQAQDAVDDEAMKAAVKAEALLAAHREQGHARILLEKGRVDAYVVLDDERGLFAALSIEYGRGALKPGQNKAFPNGAAATEGLFILHRATGIRGYS
jgi:hypothetical protein